MPGIIRITDRAFYPNWRQALEKNDPASIPSRNWPKLEHRKPIKFPPVNQVSAVASLLIEGSGVDLNFFMRFKMGLLSPSKNKKEEIDNIEALIKAYHFARIHDLNEQNLLNAHQIATRNLLAEGRGKYRTFTIVLANKHEIKYSAPEPDQLLELLQVFWEDMEQLLKSDMDIDQAFYHASLVHLVFEHLHPFADGNGRIGRLLEKWFLTSTCGPTAWNLLSEHYYERNRKAYYQGLQLGATFEELDYTGSIDFLTMLPKALIETVDIKPVNR